MDFNSYIKISNLIFRPNPVFIFDLDLTVIGHIPKRYLNISNSQFKNLIYKGINYGFIRPYFIELIDILINNNIKIIFYTASNKQWCIPILRAIEHYVGYSFINKVFTDKYCNVPYKRKLFRSIGIKSIKYIQNQINKSETKFSIKNSIILDDKITVEKKESKFLVKIPPYRWIYNPKVNKIKQPNDTLFLQIIKIISASIEKKIN